MSAILAKYLIEMNKALNGIKETLGVGTSEEALAEAIEKYLADNKSTDTIGGTTKPVYMNAGTITACSGTVGSSTKPVYMNSGTVTACSSTVGSSTKPVYMSSGAVTACSSTVGGTAKPVYMSSGTVTACSGTVGGTSNPVYMNAGTVTACSGTVGSATKPVYMNAGTITACTNTNSAQYEFNKTGLSTTSVSYSGKSSKFYIVTLSASSGSVQIPLTIAYKDLSTTAKYYYATTLESSLSSGSVGLGVVLDSSGYPTFSSRGSGVTITSVCGYY